MKSYMEYFKEICKIPHGSFETDKMKDNIKMNQTKLKNL